MDLFPRFCLSVAGLEVLNDGHDPAQVISVQFWIFSAHSIYMLEVSCSSPCDTVVSVTNILLGKTVFGSYP